MKNFQKSLKISNKIKDIKKIVKAKRGIGRYYWRKSDYNTDEKHLRECLKILKYTQHYNLISTFYIYLPVR